MTITNVNQNFGGKVNEEQVESLRNIADFLLKYAEDEVSDKQTAIDLAYRSGELRGIADQLSYGLRPSKPVYRNEEVPVKTLHGRDDAKQPRTGPSASGEYYRG